MTAQLPSKGTTKDLLARAREWKRDYAAGTLINELADEIERQQRDAERWDFFRKHHMSDYQGKRVHTWLIDNVCRADGIDAATDELIQVCATKSKSAHAGNDAQAQSAAGEATPGGVVVSLGDLKRAIAEYEEFGDAPYSHNRQLGRANAWRTAFEWRESLLNRSLQEELITEASVARWHDEREEGVRLIREKLR